MKPEERIPGTEVGRAMAPSTNECNAKEARSTEVSYIERNPASQVVLSPRLEQAVRRVGGCQTEEVLALVRQIMYEVLQSRKY